MGEEVDGHAFLDLPRSVWDLSLSMAQVGNSPVGGGFSLFLANAHLGQVCPRGFTLDKFVLEVIGQGTGCPL